MRVEYLLADGAAPQQHAGTGNPSDLGVLPDRDLDTAALVARNGWATGDQENGDQIPEGRMRRRSILQAAIAVLKTAAKHGNARWPS